MSQNDRRRSFSTNAKGVELRRGNLRRAIILALAIALAASLVFIATVAAANLNGSAAAAPPREILAPDFGVSTVPDFQTVCMSENAVYDAFVVSIEGFTEEVSLTLSGAPPTTTVDFLPESDNAPYTSTLTFSDTGISLAGVYDMVITGTWMTTEHTTTAQLTLEDVPGAATLSSPDDDSTGVALQPQLSWQAAAGATGYKVQVDDDSGFGSVDYQVDVAAVTEHTLSTPLAEDTEYYWRVIPSNDCGDGAAPDTFSFTTLADPTIATYPAAITETMVVEETVINTLTITNTGTGNLSWNIAESANGSCPASGGDIDWVTLSDTGGSEGSGSSSDVDVTFDADGKAAGYYSGALCITSNDDLNPEITLPLTMIVTDFTLQRDPTSQEICQAEDAVYSVGVHAVNGFSEVVALSLTGNPSGTTVDFSPNNTAGPYTSTLTIGSTGSAAKGGYDMVVTGLATPALHTTTVHLDIFGSPAAPSLTSPANGATDVPLKPHLVWGSVSDANSYTLEIDDDPGFGSIDYTVTVTGSTEHTVTIYLEQETTYRWRVRGNNECGGGVYSNVRTFTTRLIPPVLLVADDQKDDALDTQMRNVYISTLDAILGADGYDIWDTNNSDDEPDAEFLNYYNVVIWFTGREFSRSNPVAGPGTAGEAALAAWLDNSGCFFLSSPDYHWARMGVTPFMADYLGVDSITDDQGFASVWGLNTVFAGLGPYDLAFPQTPAIYQDYSDEIFPDGTAEVAFMGEKPGFWAGTKNAAINKQGPTYATTFLGFPLEVVPTFAEREEILTTFFGWCEEVAVPVIDSSPDSMSEEMMANEVAVHNLTITNAGTGNLVWNITESASGNCAAPSDISWITLSETSGFAGAGLSSVIEVTFDPGGIAEGEYSGALCIHSNDGTSPLVTVALDLDLKWYRTFLPFLIKPS